MHLKATILTLILTAAACISSSAATDTLNTVTTDDRKDSKFVRFLSEKVSVSGYAQVGYQYDTYDMAHDGAFNNRAMIIADIRPVRHLDLYFMADVSKFKLHELFVRYRPVDAFYIRLGQYKTPFTIESNMSPSVLEIIKGAQAVQYLAGIDGSDVCFGAGSGRDLGLEVGGEFLKIGKDNRNLIEYRVGVFSGEPSNTAETNNRKDVVASLALRPVSFLKVHGSVYFGEGTAKADSPYGTTGHSRPGIHTAGTGGAQAWRWRQDRCISGANIWKVSTHPSGAGAPTPPSWAPPLIFSTSWHRWIIWTGISP